MISPDRQNGADISDDAFGQLVMRHLADELDAEGAEKLADILSVDEVRREEFVKLCFQAQLLKSRLRPLLEQDASYTTLRPAKALTAPPARGTLSRLWHPMTLVLFVGLLSGGILAYRFSMQPGDRPAAERPLPSDPPVQVARIVETTDAQWAATFSPNGDALKPGQRLILHRGTVQVEFGKEAKVIFEGPADFVITDAATCRLDEGKLTAHVPELARGFKVHAPDGTVTDLGTDFGVYVRDQAGGNRLEAVGEEQEQPAIAGTQQDGKQASITEVHVFRGKVEFNQAPAETNPKSAIGAPGTAGHPQSTILQTGQAVTISEQKVQPLPAADPFTFALDKLNGKARQVLLAEDFESYPTGNQVNSIGPWTVQSGIRKGQGIHVYDPRAKMAEMTNDAANPVSNLSPAPAIGSRVAFIAASALNPRDTFPLLAREIDGKALAKNCQVLVEFDYMPLGGGPQFSVALAQDVGRTSGFELWRSVDAAKQGVDAAKKVDYPGYQWYRLRVLLDVADGVVRDARAERWHWLSSQGWVRELTFQPPAPKLDWSTPPRYAMFGFPVVSPSTPAGVFLLDNVRIEVIAE